MKFYHEEKRLWIELNNGDVFTYINTWGIPVKAVVTEFNALYWCNLQSNKECEIELNNYNEGMSLYSLRGNDFKIEKVYGDGLLALDKTLNIKQLSFYISSDPVYENFIEYSDTKFDNVIRLFDTGRIDVRFKTSYKPVVYHIEVLKGNFSTLKYLLWDKTKLLELL